MMNLTTSLSYTHTPSHPFFHRFEFFTTHILCAVEHVRPSPDLRQKGERTFNIQSKSSIIDFQTKSSSSDIQETKGNIVCGGKIQDDDIMRRYVRFFFHNRYETCSNLNQTTGDVERVRKYLSIFMRQDGVRDRE